MKKQQPAELGGSEETKPAKPTVTPARRVENVEEYYFSVKLKEVARMNESGTRVINLGIGSPDLPPSAETVQVLCRRQRGRHARVPTLRRYSGTACGVRPVV